MPTLGPFQPTDQNPSMDEETFVSKPHTVAGGIPRNMFREYLDMASSFLFSRYVHHSAMFLENKM